MRVDWRYGIFIVPADEMAGWTPETVLAGMQPIEEKHSLIGVEDIPRLRASQHLHSNMLMRDPGMLALPGKAIQEAGEVIRIFQGKTFEMDDSAAGVEELAKFALLVCVGGLGGNLADLFDDLLFVVALGLQNERKVNGRLVGALVDL